MMQNIIASTIRFVVKLVLGVFALVFVASLLLFALVAVVLSLLKAVVTGKKPAPTVVFGKFGKFAPGSMWPSNARPEQKSDVVDVDVREIKEPAKDMRLP